MSYLLLTLAFFMNSFPVGEGDHLKTPAFMCTTTCIKWSKHLNSEWSTGIELILTSSL